MGLSTWVQPSNVPAVLLKARIVEVQGAGRIVGSAFVPALGDMTPVVRLSASIRGTAHGATVLRDAFDRVLAGKPGYWIYELAAPADADTR